MRTQREVLRWDRRGFGQGKWSQPGASTWRRSARVCATPDGRRVEENPGGRGSFSSSAHALGTVVYLSLSSSLWRVLSIYMCHRHLWKKPLHWVRYNEFWEEQSHEKRHLRKSRLIAESRLPWPLNLTLCLSSPRSSPPDFLLRLPFCPTTTLWCLTLPPLYSC